MIRAKKSCALALTLALVFFALAKGQEDRPERVLRTPDAAFAGLPGYDFAPHYVEVGPGLRMHYVDEGPRGAGVVLLLHGQPTWSYVWRGMIPLLSQAGQRVVAPDLIGFGRSDKPGAVSDYSYARHVAWVAELIEKLDLKDITLVVHDWGGLIGLRVLAESKTPERFARLVVLNTSLTAGDVAELSHPLFAKAAGRWGLYLLTASNLKFAGTIQRGTVNPQPKEVWQAYDAPFPDDSYKAGVRVMSSLIPYHPGDAGANENMAAREFLRGFAKPVLIAFADADRSHPGMHAFFRRLFPPETVWRDVSVTGAKHFLQEDKPGELAGLINEFIAATGGKNQGDNDE